MTRAAALLSAVFVALSFASHAAAQVPQKQLTVEAIFAHGPLVPKGPETLDWSPDGKHLTYLDGGELMDVDPVTGKTHVMVSAAKMDSLDGNSGSERDRDHRERYNMAGYLWAPDSTHLLFDADGRLWLYDLRNGTGVQIGFTGAAAGDNPKFSPDGTCVSFIRDHGLSVVHLRDPGTPTIAVAPVPGASNGKQRSILNGEVDWVYRGRTRHAQQLLLVAGLKEYCLSADERDRRAAVSAHRLDSHARAGGVATLSPARRCQP